MKKIIALHILVFLSFSCNKVGETIGEVPISNSEISSIEDIDLNKGDKIVFWSKSELKYSDIPQNINYKYLISCNNKKIEFNNTNSFGGNHNLHSIKETVFDTIKISDYENERDSIVERTKWDFEQENITFVAPKKGTYTFDFKASKNANLTGTIWSNDEGYAKLSIIVRKK